MAKPSDNKPVLHTKKHIARLERERFQTRLILYSFIAILVVVVGLVVYGYLDIKYFQARRPVAKVAGTSIPIGEWQARVRMERTRLINQLQLYSQYSQYFGMDLSSQEQQITTELNTPSSLGQTVLDQMIDEQLIRDEAAKRGITASPQEVQDAIEASYGYYPKGSPTPTITPTVVLPPTLSPQTLALVTLTPTPGGPTATATSAPQLTPSPNGSPVATGAAAATGSPTATLAPSATPTETATATPAFTATPAATDTPLPTSTPYTLQGFQASYKTGLTKLEALGLTEDEIKQIYATNILRQKLFDIVTADVPRSQDEVWARHILVADQATANAVRQRLLNGEDFAKVAAQVSTDTGTKDKGGDLGWFPKGQMVAEFESAAFSLKVGEISQPVKSQFGYHIIQVLAHGNVALDATAYNQATQKAFSDWLTKLRTQYGVQTYESTWANAVPTDPAVPSIPN